MVPLFIEMVRAQVFYAYVQNWTKENVGGVQVTMENAKMLEPKKLANLHFLDAHKGNWINSLKLVDGEVLPWGTFRNFSNFLIKEHQIVPPLEMEVVQTEAKYLKEHCVIARFIELKLLHVTFMPWISTPNKAINLGKVSYLFDVGKGFFYLKTNSPATTIMVLTKPPFKTQWGTCIFQQWVPSFNLYFPMGMHLWSWISFKKLCMEFFPIINFIATQVGELLETGKTNEVVKDPSFYVAIDVDQGQIVELKIQGLTNHHVNIPIDYVNTPIRCK